MIIKVLRIQGNMCRLSKVLILVPATVHVNMVGAQCQCTATSTWFWNGCPSFRRVRLAKRETSVWIFTADQWNYVDPDYMSAWWTCVQDWGSRLSHSLSVSRTVLLPGALKDRWACMTQEFITCKNRFSHFLVFKIVQHNPFDANIYFTA